MSDAVKVDITQGSFEVFNRDRSAWVTVPAEKEIKSVWTCSKLQMPDKDGEYYTSNGYTVSRLRYSCDVADFIMDVYTRHYENILWSGDNAQRAILWSEVPSLIASKEGIWYYIDGEGRYAELYKPDLVICMEPPLYWMPIDGFVGPLAIDIR